MKYNILQGEDDFYKEEDFLPSFLLPFPPFLSFLLKLKLSKEYKVIFTLEHIIVQFKYIWILISLVSGRCLLET